MTSYAQTFSGTPEALIYKSRYHVLEACLLAHGIELIAPDNLVFGWRVQTKHGITEHDRFTEALEKAFDYLKASTE